MTFSPFLKTCSEFPYQMHNDSSLSQKIWSGFPFPNVNFPKHEQTIHLFFFSFNLAQLTNLWFFKLMLILAPTCFFSRHHFAGPDPPPKRQEQVGFQILGFHVCPLLGWRSCRTLDTGHKGQLRSQRLPQEDPTHPLWHLKYYWYSSGNCHSLPDVKIDEFTKVCSDQVTAEHLLIRADYLMCLFISCILVSNNLCKY